jgi:Fur family transcriptional regulator, stress-responsive regulator
MPVRAAERLTGAGLRVTRQRLAVLDAITPGEHLDVETIIERARLDLGSVSTQAVYDALHALDTAGLVRRIEPGGGRALFEIRVGDNHHHLVCRSCGMVVDVDCAAGAAPCLDVPDRDGFVIDEAEVTWWGYCPDCQIASREGRQRV